MTNKTNTSWVEAQELISPKFKGMFGTEDKNHKKGYYRAFTFLNTQQEFYQTFGMKPSILYGNPMISSNGGIKEKLHDYVEKCKLDIYLNLCEHDYVGADYVDNALNLQKNGGRLEN